jgi:hypothetical protein
MLEDHLYWILMCDRYVDKDGKDLIKYFPNINPHVFNCYRHFQSTTIKSEAHGQGMSRHCKGDIQRMGVEDLQTLSTFLGSKLYLMGGDNPTELDCVVFGFITVILHTFPQDTVYRIVVEKRLGNLLQHTKRMKNNYFPDWDQIIGQEPMKLEPKAETASAEEAIDKNKNGTDARPSPPAAAPQQVKPPQKQQQQQQKPPPLAAAPTQVKPPQQQQQQKPPPPAAAPQQVKPPQQQQQPQKPPTPLQQGKPPQQQQQRPPQQQPPTKQPQQQTKQQQQKAQPPARPAAPPTKPVQSPQMTPKNPAPSAKGIRN